MANDNDIIELAKKRNEIARTAWDAIYEDALDDLRFVYDVDGGQWDETSRENRKGRPIITVNKLQKFVRMLRGEMRANKISFKVIPVDNQSDPIVAGIYNGIIKMIEHLSNADIAYDTAYASAIASSIGFFRIATQYSDNNSFDQEIRIKRIMNPLSVRYDPNAQEFNFEDAKYCFVESYMKKIEFEEKYPDATYESFDGSTIGQGDTAWFEPDKAKIAEYFYTETKTKKIGMLSNGTIIELDRKNIEVVKLSGLQVVREREVEDKQIKRCLMSGAEILESPTDWAGSYIPIIPVLGDEVVVNGKRHLLSLIRGAKDPQRMYNYWSTAATENVAMSPKAPYIVDHRQIKGFEGEWEESNVKNRMFLRYKYIAGLQKPSREPPPSIPTAIVEMMRNTSFELEDQLGKYEASKGAPSNERSKVAIDARITQGEKGSFTFVDNFNRSLIYAGKQIIDLIPKVYDSARVLQIIGEDGKQKPITVNQPDVDVKSGQVITKNNLKVGKFDLIVTTGIAYASKRQEASNEMSKAMQYAPSVAHIIAPLLFRQSDWEGSKEIADRIEQFNNAQIQLQQMQGGGKPMG